METLLHCKLHLNLLPNPHGKHAHGVILLYTPLCLIDPIDSHPLNFINKFIPARLRKDQTVPHLIQPCFPFRHGRKIFRRIASQQTFSLFPFFRRTLQQLDSPLQSFHVPHGNPQLFQIPIYPERKITRPPVEIIHILLQIHTILFRIRTSGSFPISFQIAIQILLVLHHLLRLRPRLSHQITRHLFSRGIQILDFPFQLHQFLVISLSCLPVMFKCISFE